MGSSCSKPKRKILLSYNIYNLSKISLHFSFFQNHFTLFLSHIYIEQIEKKMKRLLRTMSSKPKILASKTEIDHFIRAYSPNPHPLVLKRCKEAVDSPRSLKNLNLSNQGLGTPPPLSLSLDTSTQTHTHADDEDAIKLFRALSKVHLFRRIDLSGNELTVRSLIAFEKLLRLQLHVARHSTDCHHCGT